MALFQQQLNFSTTIENLKQAKESGGINAVDFSRKAREARAAVGNLKNDKVPEFVQQEFENVTGIAFQAMGRTSEQMEQDIILDSDAAKALRPTVEADLIASGVVVTPESLNNALLNRVEKRSRDEADLEEQRRNLELGLPVEDTVISKNIQTDYQTLSSFFKNAVADGVVTRNEFLSAQLGVSNLMTTKYGQFKTDPKISAVIEQMNGLIDDIGKRVGTGPMAAEIDKMTLALQSQDFTAGTIAVVRALYEGKDVAELKSLMAKGKGDKTLEAAMVYLMETNLAEDEIVEIFNTATPPPVADVAGTNPSLLSIPTVKDNPNEYEIVVDKFSDSAKMVTSNDLLGNKEVRNSFLTSLNVAGSAVASQGDEYILGEKLLSKFASNSVVKNLETIYSVDPQNAAQTNDVLQAGLSSERVRQSLELNNRLDAGAGAGQLVMADAEGKLQLNNEMIEKNKDKLVGGAAGWAEMQGKINAAGGLEKFLQLPPMVNSAINTDASIMVSGTQYLLKDIFSIDFNKVLKLSNNLKLIDSKLVNLESLATKYQDDTDMLRGRSTNLTPSQNAEVMAAINEGSNLGIPLEDIDFDSNAPSTPVEPSGEIVTTPVDTVETTPVDRTLTSEQQNAISNVSEITKASNEPIITRAGTYSFTKTNKAIETSVKNPIKQALLKGAITVETGGAGPVTEGKYTYENAVAVGGEVWKNRMDAVGLGTNATGEEIFNAVYANRNGNGDYASGDGNRYRGRGLIQITGKTTYQGVQDILKGQGIDIDLIGNPDLANDNKYALPVALAFLEYAGLDDTSADTITTNKLNDFINSGASREIAEDRWEEVIDLLELAGMREKGEELELRNEYAAQEKAGTTADGDIGPNSRTAMTNYLTQQGVTIPQNISDDDLVILVNRN